MKTEYKIVGLSVVFFALVCTSDAVFESALFREKTFWNSLILDVSGHAVYLRSLVTLGFLVFGLVTSRAFTHQRRAEEALKESEKRFRQIYQISPVMMYSIDGTGIIRSVNGRWLDEMGHSRDEVVGGRFDAFMTPESGVRAFSIDLASLWNNGTWRNVPYQFVRKDGTVLDVLLDAAVMKDSMWGLIGLCSVRNITERKKAEEETRRTKALLDSIIHNLPVAVFLKDAERMEYVLWNRASEELYGYSSEEVIGKTARDFFPPDQADRFDSQDRETLTRGGLLDMAEEHVDTESKGPRILHTKKLPIADPDGKLRYLLGIAEDITDIKQAESDLIEAREVAEQANRAKSEFLANMSHEIRTPINGIMGMTELALNTELTPEQHEYLEATKISADSLLKVINDVLDFSKIEAGKLELISIEFGLRDVISDAMTILAVQAHKKDLELTYDIPPEIPDSVVGDPGRLRQVLVNLVGNAIKFTEQGEVGLKADIVGETPDWVDLHFTVTDTGIGIPPDKREKIFRAFEQADGSTSRKYGGTGLGLAISAKFVQMMGGKIWVESGVGEGSSFHFVVRLGLEHGSIKWEIPQATVKLQGLPVMVVDDNATNRRILEETLSYWGMKPVTADSGTKAMELLAEASERGKPFPLIITDCMMPGMDGFELVERIKQNPHTAVSTIIMLTSSGERGDASRCVKLGISAYLVKPIKQSELLFTVAKVLETPAQGEVHTSLITRHSIRESTNRFMILLAEDHPVNRTVALRMLERMGHSVSLAGNGAEALEALKRVHFDLILMDIQMPEMDGLEATKAIREWEKTTGKHIPVIAMTAYALKGDEEKCLQAGMDGYISKPVSAQQLYETIEATMDPSSRTGGRFTDLPAKREALDKQVIVDRVGGDMELLREIADLFLQDYPRLVVKIKGALHQGNPELLEKAAHTLKGSVSNFGAESAVQAALNLENMGRSRNMTEAPQTVVNLERELERLREDLASFMKELAP